MTHVTKRLLCITLATLLPAVAYTSESLNGYFIDGSFGSSTLDALGSSAYPFGQFNASHTTGAFAIDTGYRWHWFGVEVGYFQPGSFHESLNLTDISNSYVVRSRVHGATMGANAHINIGNHWFFAARTGLFRSSGSADVAGSSQDSPTSGPTSMDVSKTSWYGGIGMGYDISENFGISLALDRYEADDKQSGIDLSTNVRSVLFEYRF